MGGGPFLRIHALERALEERLRKTALLLAELLSLGRRASTHLGMPVRKIFNSAKGLKKSIIEDAQPETTYPKLGYWKKGFDNLIPGFVPGRLEKRRDLWEIQDPKDLNSTCWSAGREPHPERR